MARFELRRLIEYDDTSLIREIQRVSSLVPGEVLTVSAFDALAKVHSTTLRNRFGGWREALAAAGLASRYNSSNKSRSKEEVVAELRRVAEELGTRTLARRDFEKRARFKTKAVVNTFGTWRSALQAAGLSPTYVRDWCEEECFENLLAVWTNYGRAPNYREMLAPPSRVSGKVYVRRFGSWSKALAAFVAFAEQTEATPSVRHESATSKHEVRVPQPKPGPRDVPLALRYFVLKRDRFRCVLCGSNPATQAGCVLHVDHFVPYSKGGPTDAANLRTLCDRCNLGKGNKFESPV